MSDLVNNIFKLRRVAYKYSFQLCRLSCSIPYILRTVAEEPDVNFRLK